MEEDILALSDQAGVTERFRVTDTELLAWPTERLWRRIKETSEKREEEARQDAERWLLNSWSLSRTIFYALRFGDETPPTRDEYKKQQEGKKPTEKDFSEWEKTREQMHEQKAAVLYTIQSPQHHGAELGAVGIVDEPSETLEEFKEQVANAGKPDYKQQQANLEEADQRMRESAIREKREREHRS